MATMEHTAGKPSSFRNVLTRLLLFGVFLIGVRFAYVIAVAGESCTVGDFCFFSLHETLSLVIAGAGANPLAAKSATATAAAAVAASPARPKIYTSKEWTDGVRFYSSVFKDLIAGGYLSPASKSLCVESPTGRDVFAMREIGVKRAVGISRKAAKPLVKSGRGHRIPFAAGAFDFVFSGEGSLERSPLPVEFAAEISRTLKPEGFAAFHLVNPKDTYSFNSFLDLFSSCFRLVKSRDIEGFDSSMPRIREIVLKKECDDDGAVHKLVKSDYFDGGDDDDSNGKCSVPG